MTGHDCPSSIAFRTPRPELSDDRGRCPCYQAEGRAAATKPNTTISRLSQLRLATPLYAITLYRQKLLCDHMGLSDDGSSGLRAMNLRDDSLNELVRVIWSEAGQDQGHHLPLATWLPGAFSCHWYQTFGIKAPEDGVASTFRSNTNADLCWRSKSLWLAFPSRKSKLCFSFVVSNGGEMYEPKSLVQCGTCSPSVRALSMAMVRTW